MEPLLWDGCPATIMGANGGGPPNMELDRHLMSSTARPPSESRDYLEINKMSLMSSLVANLGIHNNLNIRVGIERFFIF